MNLTCSYCQTPFTLGMAEKATALQRMHAEDLHHYDAHCPRCGRANAVSRERLEMFTPGWQEAIKETAPESAPASPAELTTPEPAMPVSPTPVLLPNPPAPKAPAKRTTTRHVKPAAKKPAKPAAKNPVKKAVKAKPKPKKAVKKPAAKKSKRK